MSPLAVADDPVAQADVAQAVLPVHLQQAPAAQVEARHRRQQERVGEVRQVVQHGVDRRRSPLALQEVGNALGGHQAADAVDRESQYRLEQRDVADAVTADHVPDGDGADHVRQHLVDHEIAQVGVEQPGETADAQVEPEQLGVLGRFAGTLPVQVAELGQREGEDLQRDVAAGDERRELGREQRRVGAGDDPHTAPGHAGTREL